jgi:hypothetical protein
MEGGGYHLTTANTDVAAGAGAPLLDAVVGKMRPERTWSECTFTLEEILHCSNYISLAL